MSADRVPGETEQPPSSRPAWRWLWGTVAGGGASIAVADGALASTSVQGPVELTIALTAVASVLAWIRVNRGALQEREARSLTSLHRGRRTGVAARSARSRW